MRFAIPLALRVREVRQERRRIEELTEELAREPTAALQKQQPQRGHVLVDFRLQLQIEQRHGARTVSIPHVVMEVTDALERGAEIGQVLLGELLQRTARP